MSILPWKRSAEAKEKKQNLQFIVLMTIFVAAMLIFQDQPQIAMWIGFILAGYSAIANDSIQTLGTFLSSNHKVPWWVLWLFLGGVLAAIFTYGFVMGDVAYGRLERIPEPTEFSFFQLLAPVILIILTQFKMPVSTTFLLLAVFSNGKTISGMLEKTFIGYFIAFTVALIIWAVIAELQKKKKFFHSGQKYNKKLWRGFQWVATAFLWSTWLMQDTANVVVFLPRDLSTEQFIAVLASLLAGMGLLLYLRGGRIQEIVTEKTDVVDVRAATIIALVFGTLLLLFKEWNNLPMSTTWVFLGLLAGREIALARISGKEKPYLKTLGLVMKDLGLASIGLVISIILAFAASSQLTLNEIIGTINIF